MKFGYFANQNNRGLEKPFRRIIEETRGLARYLDGQDWESIWFTEHHFGHEGFEVCPGRSSRLCLLNSVHERSSKQQAAVRARLARAETDSSHAIINAAIERWFTPACRADRPATSL